MRLRIAVILLTVLLIVVWLAPAALANGEETPRAAAAPKADDAESVADTAEESTERPAAPEDIGNSSNPSTSAADSRPREGAASPRQSMRRRFDQSSPAIGEPLPDVAAYDAEGNPINLNSLRGHYSVIVFGCLT